MTLSQLLDALNNLPDDNMRVLTRGSSPTTMVDVEQVRVIKLKSGDKAVFIGKPKAD